MKSILMMLLTLLFAISSTSCKKDYPKDIPKWLEQRIKQMKKENPCNDNPVQIQEYKGNNSDNTLYLFTKPCPFCYHEVYDFDGNMICNNISVWTGHDSCGVISFNDYSFKRLIWEEKCK